MNRLDFSAALPADADTASLVGRVWLPSVAGPSVVTIRDGQAIDITATYPTVRDLCETPDPAAALRAMAQVLAPEGRLILIEHGRTNTWAWLDAQLDAGAAAHAAKWGCEWNRDILQAVAEAGLVVERVSRWHFGSTTVVYARPVEK